MNSDEQTLPPMPPKKPTPHYLVQISDKDALLSVAELQLQQELQSSLKVSPELSQLSSLVLAYCALDFQCKHWHSKDPTSYDSLESLYPGDGFPNTVELTALTHRDLPPMSAMFPFTREPLLLHKTSPDLGDNPSQSQSQNQSPHGSALEPPQLLFLRKGLSFVCTIPEFRDVNIREEVDASQFRILFPSDEQPATPIHEAVKHIVAAPNRKNRSSAVAVLTTASEVFMVCEEANQANRFSVVEIRSGLSYSFCLTGVSRKSSCREFLLYRDFAGLHVTFIYLAKEKSGSCLVLRTGYQATDFNYPQNSGARKQEWKYLTRFGQICITIPLPFANFSPLPSPSPSPSLVPLPPPSPSVTPSPTLAPAARVLQPQNQGKSEAKLQPQPQPELQSHPENVTQRKRTDKRKRQQLEKPQRRPLPLSSIEKVDSNSKCHQVIKQKQEQKQTQNSDTEHPLIRIQTKLFEIARKPISGYNQDLFAVTIGMLHGLGSLGPPPKIGSATLGRLGAAATAVAVKNDNMASLVIALLDELGAKIK